MTSEESNGNIFSALVAFSLPIMATSLLQTAYSLIDMVWIGRVGSDAVAAIGAASMFTWFANSVAMLARTGGQIKVAHSYGENDPDAVKEYGRGALQLVVILGLSFGTIVNLIPNTLIGFFNLDSGKVFADAVIYLRIVCGLILGSFISMTLTGLFTASGDSRTPFFANSTGLIINMILDPILIFGIMVVWGFVVSVVFITLAEPLFSVFINEADIIPGGASYLRILGYGEIFECVEMMTSGALAGLGRTLEASVISISLTAVRIPLALALSGTALGLDGIWWAIALSSIMKGIVFFIAFKFMTRRTKAHDPG